MSRSDHLVSAMRSGAGLPVLSILDRFLEARAEGKVDATMEAETLSKVLDQVDAWLGAVAAKLDERLDEADEGPLKTTMADHGHRLIAQRRHALAAIRARREEGEGDEAAWAMLEAEFLRLHTLRQELGQINRAATHLREVARIITDVPRDKRGQAALDEFAGLEALAASHHTPADWVKAARELERTLLRAVRLEAPVEFATDAPAGNGAGKPNGANGHAKVELPASVPKRNGSSAHAPARPSATLPPHQRSFVYGERLVQPPQRPLPRRGQHAPTREAPSGPEVLRSWTSRLAELADRGDVPEGLRHAPFWAPIAAGLVAAPRGDVRELLTLAAEVEIDLIEIELPRISAIATGGTPEALRERIAERAREITLNDPKRPARETLLDYIVGKLPVRYRESAEGLALVESVAHALATNEPWETSEHDYAEIVRAMVAAELDRSPAVDIQELATSLIGGRHEALEIVEEAALELAADDPGITIYPDGIMVRALAQREDPDKLYKLRQALESRLGTERAAQLIRALITAGEDTQ